MAFMYSVIVLLEERHDDFSEFVRGLYNVLVSYGNQFEVLVVANGTGTFLREELSSLGRLDGRLKALEFPTRTSQAVCLRAALAETEGNILLVCGGYQQISNDSLLKILRALDANTDIVAPWRKKRVDALSSRLQSRLFNFVVNKLTGSELHDLSCTVKIFRREVLEETALYGNMYRFLPIIAGRRGFKTLEVPCEHYEERGKTGFYSASEYVDRLIDVFTLYFNTRFTKKPLRFFSAAGLVLIFASITLVVGMLIQRLLFEVPLGNRPLLIAAVLMTLSGVSIAGMGLLGEIVTFVHGRHKKEYTVEKEL
jgi:hypothetical protein